MEDKNILSGKDKIYYFDNFYNQQNSQQIFYGLKNNILWDHFKIVIFGKYIFQPRLTAFYGDKGLSYKYSGKELDAKLWTKELLDIKLTIEEKIHHKFNSVLCNYYRDHHDSMGWHRDNEKSLGDIPVIASLSFGAERIFKLRKYHDHKQKKDIMLKNGSLLVMMGTTQMNWEHSIPKEKLPLGERINLTFRKIVC